jgi:large subunit ribosomal protein L17
VSHRKAGRQFGRNSGQRKALMRGLISSVILTERIITTEEKGKNVQPQVEKIITIAREDTEAHRRLVMAKLANPLATLKLFEEIGPRFEGQPGGYTLLFHLGQRQGDGAPMVVLRLME